MNFVKIKGMSCQHCVASVKEALEKIDGVSDVSVDLEKGEANFNGDVTEDSLKKVITAIGFEVGNG
jgi:copper chaperone CopZ